MPEIAHFIAFTGTAMGGPVHSMAAYASLAAHRGCSVTVYSSHKNTDGQSVRLDPGIKLVQGPAQELGPLRYSATLRRQAWAAGIDLVHSHGLWTDAHRLAGQITRAKQLPHLLAPCGMLSPGALKHHQFRKLAALVWFQKRVLRDTDCLHAKSNMEYQDIRRFGLRNPVAIIANPISRPPKPSPAAESHFRRACHIPDDGKILLYLGRLHPVKGLPRLIRAWSQVAGRYSNWTLVLAGPGEAGHRRDLECLSTELKCQNRLVFTGELGETRKWTALRAAELFVMPSDFENFGNSIAESLTCGIPVITTTRTPWEALPKAGAGWCVKPAAEALALALDEALGLSDDQRHERGLRAADLACAFRPELVCANLLAVYEWLLGKVSKPDCVREN